MDRDHYSKMARECLAVAETVPDTEQRLGLLEVAQQFQHLAAHAATATPPDSQAGQDGRDD
jgi:hypothetical protein